MGDGADLALEYSMAEEDYRIDHPYEFEDENCDVCPSRFTRYTQKQKVCRCCGEGGLHWGLTTGEKWLLINNKNETHQCKVNPYKKKL